MKKRLLPLLAPLRPSLMSALSPLLEHKRTYADVGKST
jgi:hypothetical protein